MRPIKSFVQRLTSNKDISKSFKAAKNTNTVAKYSGRTVVSLSVNKKISFPNPSHNGKKSFCIHDAKVKQIPAQRKNSISCQATLNANGSVKLTGENKKRVSTEPVKKSYTTQLSPPQKTTMSALKTTILNINNLNKLETISKTIDQQLALNDLTSDQIKELKSLINMKKNILEIDKKYCPEESMNDKVFSLKTLGDAVSFKRLLMKESVSGKLTNLQSKKLQNQLMKQLYVIAKDRDQARHMTIEFLKNITGEYSVAKQIQQTVTATVGYTPHKETLELQERLYRLHN